MAVTTQGYSAKPHMDAWPAELDTALAAALQCGRRMAEETGAPAFACVSAPFAADIEVFRAAVWHGDHGPFAVYWRDADRERLAFGCAAQAEGAGPDALAAAQEAYDDWRTRLVCGSGARPHFFMGAAFDPCMPRAQPWTGWPGAWLVLPAFTIERAGRDMATLTVTVRVGVDDDVTRVLDQTRARFPSAGTMSARADEGVSPVGQESVRTGGKSGRGIRRVTEWTADEDVARFGATPETDRWVRIVSAGAKAVRSGHFDKVVLARSEREAGHFSVEGVVRVLASVYPTAVTFAVRRGGQVFVGATPERLATVRAGSVQVDCLAGSSARAADEVQDQRQAAALLLSGKNRAEHEAVVRGVLADLADAAVQLTAAEQPVIRTLPNLHHLFTPVSGRLAPGEGVLSVVRRLHPTPAVAGLPRREAMRTIAEWERMDRGWYAGPVGWLDGRGDGEFAVALRCGLLDASGAYLYAGVGVVAESDPWAEWLETEWKLAPMRRALVVSEETPGLPEGDEWVGV